MEITASSADVYVSLLVAAISAAVGGLTLVATLFLTILGFRIVSEVSNSLSKIKSMEEAMAEDRGRFEGVRTISSILLDYVGSSFVMSKLQFNTIHDLLNYFEMAPESERVRRQGDALLQAAAGFMEDSILIQELLKIFNAKDDEVEESIEILLSQFPPAPLDSDRLLRARRAYDFLMALANLSKMDAEVSGRFTNGARRLSKKVRLPHNAR